MNPAGEGGRHFPGRADGCLGRQKCFSDSIKPGFGSREGVGGFVALPPPILPRAANSRHHPRAYQAEHLNIFASLIETRAGRGRGEGLLGF